MADVRYIVKVLPVGLNNSVSVVKGGCKLGVMRAPVQLSVCSCRMAQRKAASVCKYTVV